MNDVIEQTKQRANELDEQVTGFFATVNDTLSSVPEAFVDLIEPIERGMREVASLLDQFWETVRPYLFGPTGDPFRLSEAAREWQLDVANELGDVGASLKGEKFDTDYTWTGSGAAAYRGLIPSQREGLKGVESAARELNSTLDSLGDAIQTFWVALLGAIVVLYGGLAGAAVSAAGVVTAPLAVGILAGIIPAVIGFIVAVIQAAFALLTETNAAVRTLENRLDQLPKSWDGGSKKRWEKIRDVDSWEPFDDDDKDDEDGDDNKDDEDDSDKDDGEGGSGGGGSGHVGEPGSGADSDLRGGRASGDAAGRDTAPGNATDRAGATPWPSGHADAPASPHDATARRGDQPEIAGCGTAGVVDSGSEVSDPASAEPGVPGVRGSGDDDGRMRLASDGSTAMSGSASPPAVGEGAPGGAGAATGKVGGTGALAPGGGNGPAAAGPAGPAGAVGGGFGPAGMAGMAGMAGGRGQGGEHDGHRNSYTILRALDPELQLAYGDADVVDPATGMTVLSTVIGDHVLGGAR